MVLFNYCIIIIFFVSTVIRELKLYDYIIAVM